MQNTYAFKDGDYNKKVRIYFYKLKHSAGNFYVINLLIPYKTHYKYIISYFSSHVLGGKKFGFVLINVKHITVNKIKVHKKIVVTKISIDFSLKNRISEFPSCLKRKNQMFRLLAYTEKLTFLVQRIHCFFIRKEKK